jgi:hypothetical protein
MLALEKHKGEKEGYRKDRAAGHGPNEALQPSCHTLAARPHTHPQACASRLNAGVRPGGPGCCCDGTSREEGKDAIMASSTGPVRRSE